MLLKNKPITAFSLVLPLRSLFSCFVKQVIIGIFAFTFTGAANAVFSPEAPCPDPAVDWTRGGATYDPIDDTISTIYGSSGYATSSNGPYTHYVDNSGTCSDSTNGTVASPRCNIPTTIPAGSIVEIHGGPYTYSANFTITLNGTATQPVFFIALDGAIIRRVNNSKAINLSWEGTDYILKNVTTRRIRNDINGTRWACYDCDMGWTDKLGLGMHDGPGLVYRGRFHHNIGDDKHGLFIGSGGNRIHVVEPELDHNSGDGIQFCHNCSLPVPTKVFISGVDAHSNRENAIDLKFSSKVMICGGETYAHRDTTPNVPFTLDDAATETGYATWGFSATSTSTSASDGEDIVLGSDGDPTEVYMFRVTSHDSAAGFRIEGVGSTVGIANNLFYNNNRGFIWQKRSPDYLICNNTFANNVNSDGFTQSAIAAQQLENEIYGDFENNIIYEMNGLLFDQRKSLIATQMNFDNNIAYEVGGTIDARWGGPTVTVNDTASLNGLGDLNGGALDPYQNNQWADPVFVDSAAGDYGIQVTSPAIDNATDCMERIQTAVDASFSDYTLNVMVDNAGNSIPTVNPDIGAFQFGSSPPTPTDNQPICVTCQNSPFTEDSGNASYTKSVTLTDDFSSVTVNDVVFTPTVSNAADWSFNGTTISYTGTTVVETVTLDFDMSDGVNADKAAQIILNFQTPESQVPPTAGSVPDQSNQETDEIAIPVQFTLTNGDALSSIDFSGTESTSYTQSLSILLDSDCNGTAAGWGCITGVLEEAQNAIYPLTQVVGTNAASGTASFAANACTIGIAMTRDTTTDTCSNFTINGVSGTEKVASFGTVGGAGGGVTVLTTTPITALKNAESGTVTIAPEGVTDYALLMCHSSQASAARTYTDMTVDSVSATSSIFANVDGGRAAMAGCYIWVESALPTTNGTYNWALTLNTGSVADELYFFAELSGVDQTTGFGTTTATTTATALTSGGTIAPAAITDGEGELVLSLLAISDTSSDATANDSVDPTQADTVVIAPTYNRDAANGEHGLGVSFDDSGASASETYTWTAAFNPTTTIDSAVSLAVTILSAGGGGGGAAATACAYTWPSVSAGSQSWAVTWATGTNPLTQILQTNAPCDSFGTSVTDSAINMATSNTDLANATSPAATTDAVLTSLILADGSTFTPASTVSNTDTAITAVTSTQQSIQSYVDNKAASGSITYTATQSNGGVEIDAGLLLSIPITRAPSSDAIVGASAGSPESVGVCATDDDGVSSPCATFTHTITSAGANQPPIANDETQIYIPGEQTCFGEEESVLMNDTDPDIGDVLTATTTLVTNPESGTYVLNADGTGCYTPGSGYLGDTFIDYQVCDDAVSPLCDTGRVFLLAIDAPSIYQPSSAATYSENVVEGSSMSLATVLATDATSYSKGSGQDCSFFTINSTTGVREWTAGTAPTFTGVDDAYPCSYTATNASGSDIITITTNVTDDGVVTGAPVISSNGGGTSASLGSAEGQTAVTDVNASDTTSYSFCGDEDDALFSIDSGTGVVTWLSAPDFETKIDDNKDGVYKACVQATGDGGIDMQNLSITVTNVIEIPSAPPAAALTIRNGQTNVRQAISCPTEATAVTAEVAGDDAALFSITTSGVITKAAAADILDVSYIYNARCESAAGNSSATAYTITVFEPVIDTSPVCSIVRSVVQQLSNSLEECNK